MSKELGKLPFWKDNCYKDNRETSQPLDRVNKNNTFVSVLSFWPNWANVRRPVDSSDRDSKTEARKTVNSDDPISLLVKQKSQFHNSFSA